MKVVINRISDSGALPRRTPLISGQAVPRDVDRSTLLSKSEMVRHVVVLERRRIGFAGAQIASATTVVTIAVNMRYQNRLADEPPVQAFRIPPSGGVKNGAQVGDGKGRMLANPERTGSVFLLFGRQSRPFGKRLPLARRPAPAGHIARSGGIAILDAQGCDASLIVQQPLAVIELPAAFFIVVRRIDGPTKNLAQLRAAKCRQRHFLQSAINPNREVTGPGVKGILDRFPNQVDFPVVGEMRYASMVETFRFLKCVGWKLPSHTTHRCSLRVAYRPSDGGNHSGAAPFCQISFPTPTVPPNCPALCPSLLRVYADAAISLPPAASANHPAEPAAAPSGQPPSPDPPA